MGQTGQSHTREVKIEKLLTKGVIQETVQDFGASFAAQEYHQAVDVLKQILQENTDLRSEESVSVSVNSVGRNAGKRREIFNVIPFIGERGTGKTSVMLSFANMLAGFDQMKDAYASFLPGEDYRSGNNYKFVVLQYIDVSVLKSKEDILAIILARMLKYIKKVVDRGDFSGYGVQTVRQEELRQLYQRFERVYSDLLNLTQESQASEGESVLRKLQNLNSSYSLSEKFQELVGAFLRFLSRNDDSQSRQYYLVIALDDIDLYEPDTFDKGRRKDAYTILGQVYEYLQIPGVVVLTTYDEVRLVRACMEHIENSASHTEGWERRAQVNQYIQKVILPKYKIYMPCLGYTDYPEERRFSIDVDVSTKLGASIFSDKAAENGNEYCLSPKKLMLAYLAHRYNCYFDTLGKKQHFFEKRTLREIKNMFLALQTEGGESYSEADEKVREQRYIHLMSYIYNQFNGEMLADAKESALLRKWLSMPVERRSKEILEYIRTGRSKLDQESDYRYRKVGDGRKYSYGELVYNLYCSSRCGIFSKEMVSCILASYSLVLPQLYWQYRNGEEKAAEDAYSSLRKVLGASIAGRWSNEILYTTFTYRLDPFSTKIQPEAKIGSVSTKSFGRIEGIPISNELGDAFHKILISQEDEEADKCFQEFLHKLEIIQMFFTNIRSASREEQQDCRVADYKFIIGGDDSTLPDKEGFDSEKVILDGQLNLSEALPKDNTVFLKSEATHACFNILNFVVNSFTWKEYFAALHDSLLNAMKAYCKLKLAPRVKKRVLDKIRTLSYMNDFEVWANENGSCAIPFQHFDMTYNILKRQRDDTNHGLPERAEASEFYASCQTVYENISAALKEQDDYYKGFCVSELQKAFVENPFYKEFKKYEEDMDFHHYLEKIARVLISEESEWQVVIGKKE